VSERSGLVARFMGSVLRSLGAGPTASELALFPERNPGPVLLCAHDGHVLYANPAARRALGLATHAPGAESPLSDLGDRLRRLWDSGIADSTFDCPVAGRLFSCRMLSLRDRGVAHVYLTDVTETRTAEDRFAHARGHDALTGLGNRVSFEARVEQALLDRPDGRVVVLLVDLDRLRRVNESLGHAAGDRLLREAAERLKSAAQGLGGLRGEAFRFEGDTFGVLLATVGPDAAPARLASSVHAAFDASFALPGREVFITASLGIALGPADGAGAAGLLRAAEVALDQVKQRGGNGFQCYAAALDSMAREFLDVESALHRAVERGQLFLAYQPQVELARRRETGREALLRWRHPQHGVVPPDRFLPVAEESGLMSRIGAWATREACRAARDWAGVGGPPPRLAVNVSAPQLHDPRFCEGIAAVLSETGLPSERLEIEITEGTAMTDPEAVAGTLRRLKETGVGVAIDDFGTGYSSLSYLSRFPSDRIKIDRSFVQRIGDTPEAEGIVRAVIEIGHRLGMSVLGEGVETEAQAEALRSWGCDEAQGFLFGRAVEEPDPAVGASLAHGRVSEGQVDSR